MLKLREKRVSFHKLLLKRKLVLLNWLAALKRKKPPMGAEARVCSEHFLEKDYIEKKTFESGNLVVRRSNTLKPEVAPSVFDFSGYDARSTDRPAFSDSNNTEVSVRRRERALKRDRQAMNRQV